MASGSRKYGFDKSRFEKAVSRNFECSVCRNVLKDPKTCRNNEHIFCLDCITEHLEHSPTCPECRETLTLETLKRPSRLFLNCLSELSIKCNHYNRGCRQYLQFEELPNHVMNCDFAPVLCSNQDCGREINKRDRIYHEAQQCEYRVKSQDYAEIKKEMDEMKINMDEVKRDLAELKTEMAESREKVNKFLHRMKTDVDEIKINESFAKVKTDLAETMKTSLGGEKKELLKDFRATTGEVSRNFNASQSNPRVKPAVKHEDIIIIGGLGDSCRRLSSVERFNWRTISWIPLTPMKQPYFCAASFVYNNQIFVAGGCNNGGPTESVEMMNIHEEPVRWETSPAKLPIKVLKHKTVVYQNRLIVVGGYDETQGRLSNAIYEVLLTPPYSTELLRRLPEARTSHGTELINDKVFILGGYTDNGATDSVLTYDVATNKLTQMPSLLYEVWDMTTVSWRDKVILLGGVGKNDGCLTDVLMYDTVTGETEVLPPMKHKRRESSAVVTGERIVVMGGKDGEGEVLDLVECYNFSSKSWEELPPMTERRRRGTAVVKPVNVF